jgi:DNA-binding Lrp family transcriptional regulator
MAFKGDVKLNSKIDSALRKIAAAGGEYSQIDLAKKLGVSSDRIYQRQKKLKAEGLIFKISYGRPQYSKKVIDAIDNIVKEFNVFKKIKLIPSNFAEQMSKKYDIPSYTVTAGLRNLKDINLKSITAARPEVVAAYEEYIKLPKDIKKIYGTKSKILDKYIKNPSRFDKRYFGEVLNKTKESVKEIRPVGKNFSAYDRK